MEVRPEFTVIAGPNGAGKSRLSPYYIHCKSFDGDLLALNLRKEHPEWEERWIGGTVAGELQKQKENAISLHKDFAFETNFSNDLILNMIDEFKSAEYKITADKDGVIVGSVFVEVLLDERLTPTQKIEKISQKAKIIKEKINS